MRSLCGQGWNPREALFARRPPSDLAPYRQIFRCKLRFNSELTAIRFPRQALELRLAPRGELPDATRADVIAPDQTVAYVRRFLPGLRVEAKCSLKQASQRLGLHPRTLGRRLELEGTDFRTLMGEARFIWAQQLIVNTDLSLGEIATYLGYSEAGAFSRAFRRWSGVSPRYWRR